MAVLIDPKALSPIPPGSEIGVCVKCLRKCGRWVFNKKESWCAHCFVSSTDWAIENSHKLRKLASDVETKSGIKILDETGAILESESDRILASVVAASLIDFNKRNRNK